MSTSLISLFSSSAASSAAGSASITSSTVGLIEVAVSAQEAKTRRGNHELTRLAFSWRWNKIRGSNGYGKHRVSIDDDNGVTVEYWRCWPFTFLQDCASHEAMSFSRSKRGSSGSVTTRAGVSQERLDVGRTDEDLPPPLGPCCCLFQASLARATRS